MSAIARWCFRHRFAVIAAWVLVLVGLGTLAQAVKSDYNNSFSLPGTGSTTAQQLLGRAIPAQAGDSDTIVWQVSHGTVRDATVTVRMSGILKQIATMPEVAAVASPYEPHGATQISRDGRTAYATVNFAKQANNLAKADITRVIDAAEAARAPGLNVQLGGQAIEQTEQTSLGVSSTVGVLAAAVVLFIAFGSLLAMLLPIVTAIVGVGGGLMAIAPLTHTINVVDFAPILGALIGLGVGIDYALFIVTRHRRGLQSGLTPEQAAVKAVDTSGRAVLFAGSTVCIALLGILVLGVSFLNGLAIASALTVVFTVLAAVTLLPALLGVFGMRVLSRRQRLRVRGVAPRELTLWARWAGTVERRPAILAVAAAAVMLVLAIPVLSLRLGSWAATSPVTSGERRSRTRTPERTRTSNWLALVQRPRRLVTPWSTCRRSPAGAVEAGAVVVLFMLVGSISISWLPSAIYSYIVTSNKSTRIVGSSIGRWLNHPRRAAHRLP